MKLLWKILNVVITVVLVAVILGCVGLAVAAKRSGDAIPTFMNHKVLTVLSGSMEPVIHTGDLIVVKALQPTDTIAENDVITFRTKEKADMLITHRVVGTVLVNGSPTAYVTKGDANDSKDLGVVSRDQIIGRYSWHIPYFGYVTNFARKPIGIVLCVVVPGLLLIAGEFRKMWVALAEEEKAKAAKSSDTPKADPEEHAS